MPNEMENTTNKMAKQMNTWLDLSRIFHGSNYRLIEGIVGKNETTLLFEEKNAPCEQPFRWGIRLILQKNHWKVQTEKCLAILF